MESYKNLGGDSGVVGYEIGQTEIKVQFRDRTIYLYTSQSAGPERVEHMKQLAEAGRGLNSYINLVVKMAYASKRRL